MSTFGQLQDRIETDYLNRTDLNPSVQRCIQAAVRQYERKPYWFNETSSAIACVASQSYVALPSNFFSLDLLQVTESSSNVKLIRKDHEWIRRANTVPTFGIPTHFAIYQNRIELFPIPSSAYSLPIYFLHKFNKLSASSDTSDWTSAMEDVVVYHATKLLWATVLYNTEKATTFQAFELQALQAVMGEKEQRQLTAIKPTKF